MFRKLKDSFTKKYFLSFLLIFIPAFSFAGISILENKIILKNDGEEFFAHNKTKDSFVFSKENIFYFYTKNNIDLKSSLDINKNYLKANYSYLDTDHTFLPESNQVRDKISVYVVKEGDNLYDIARLFDISISAIIWANDIKDRYIYPNQELLILPIEGVSHIVIKGDTIEKIAKKYGGDVSEIISYNELYERKISIGNKIIIPQGEISGYHSHDAPHSYSKTNNTSKRQLDPTGYFTYPAPVSWRSQGIHGKNAIDMAGPYGSDILSAAAGNVLISKPSGWNGGYGNYIIISHANGTQTLYSHLSQNLVYGGQYVTKGQLIGKMGSTGKSTGTHLHFEVRGGVNPF